MSSSPPAPTYSTTDLAEPLSVVLAEPRRRYALSVLASGPECRTSFEDLAIGVTAFERANADDETPDAPSEEVEVTLYHCHLPKLEEVGLVEPDYDPDGHVALTEMGLECAEALGVGRHCR
jgi:hypothetical protein